MTIKSVIKKEETIEKEISLPYFCKYKNLYWMKVVDEETMLRVYWNTEKSNTVALSPVWLNTTELAESEPIEESEFNEYYHKANFEQGKYVPVPDAPAELFEGYNPSYK